MLLLLLYNLFYLPFPIILSPVCLCLMPMKDADVESLFLYAFHILLFHELLTVVSYQNESFSSK